MRKTPDPEIPGGFDVVVIGGGAAGLSAALVLGRARRRVAVVDARTPRNAPAEEMHGFLTRDGTPPSAFLDMARSELSRYGVVLIDDRVVGIEGSFSIELAGGEVLTTRRIVIATGAHDELPEIPGVRERWGRDLLHCPYCHGWEIRDRPLGVLGTNSASAAHARLVRQWSEDVVYFEHTESVSEVDRAALEAWSIPIVSGTVAGLIIDDDRLVGLEMVDGRTFERAALFVRTINRPNGGRLLAALGCELDNEGFVATDADGRTSVPGVWAAGNVVEARLQVISSAGAGSSAAIAINLDLIREDTAYAVESRRGSPLPGGPTQLVVRGDDRLG